MRNIINAAKLALSAKIIGRNTSGNPLAVAIRGMSPVPLFKDSYMDLVLHELNVSKKSNGEDITSLTPEHPILPTLYAVRHAYFNNILEAQTSRAANPAAQIIIIGAGFDTRAVRKADYRVKWYEIDLEPILKEKERIYKKYDLDSNATYIAADCNQLGFIRKLIESGIDVAKPTHIIWEESVSHLDRETFFSTLDLMKSIFTERLTISFDYYKQDVVAATTPYESLNMLSHTWANMGRPLRLGFDRPFRTLFGNHGYQVLDNATYFQLYRNYKLEETPHEMLTLAGCCTIQPVSIKSENHHKFFKRDKIKKHEIQYRAPENADELNQYFAIRDVAYKTMHNVEIGKDATDQDGEFILAVQNGKVLGGINFILSRRGSNIKLPVESYGFKLESFCPDVREYDICEACRLCVEPALFNTDIGSELTKQAYIKGDQSGCKYLFGAGIPKRAAIFKKVAQSVFYYADVPPERAQIKYEDKIIELSLVVTYYHRNKNLLAAIHKSNNEQQVCADNNIKNNFRS